jgi:hypothetical protein
MMFLSAKLKKPDVDILRKYYHTVKLLFIVALFSICSDGYSQDVPDRDTVLRVDPGTLIQIRDSISFFLNDSLIRVPASIIPSINKNTDRNLLYYDSLREKASRKNFTKKIYDLVVVAPHPVGGNKINRESEDSYKGFSGRIIRNINYVRLDPFGTKIDNPASVSDRSSTMLLNKTHVNTMEKIIRKNLFVSSGDTVSPLSLSDNERMLRELPYISDARIIVVPVSDEDVDLLVVTKDIYSLGADYDYGGFKKGALSVFEKNILGTGHEFGIKIPFNSDLPDSPGFGGNYGVNNLWKSFIDLKAEFLSGLGSTSYGISLNRKFVSANTKYAGGVLFAQTFTTIDLDTMPQPVPLKFNMQDYWIARSFLIDRESVSRIIISGRYLNNNVFKKPDIQPKTYYSLQKYQLIMASAALSVQKFYKANLIYGYGRTEDVPYGGLVRFTAGREFNEFKVRTYMGTDLAFGKSFPEFGYLYGAVALASFFSGSQREQGIFYSRLNYFTNLLPVGKFRSRNFITIDYSRGIGRYYDENLKFIEANGFTGFKNDSIKGTQRLTVSLESVLFSPVDYYGFRFAFFGFTDLGFLSNSDQVLGNGFTLISLGVGLRIRNDNLVFNTLQIRLAFFPNPPLYSEIHNLTISGEQLLRPKNFNADKPAIIPFH